MLPRMPTLTWKEVVNGGNQIIKIDDRRGEYPAVDEEVELNGRRYKVVGMEEANVLVEPLEPPPADPSTEVISPEEKRAAQERAQRLQQGLPVADAGPDHASLALRNERVAQRRADERATVTSARHVDAKPHTAAPSSKATTTSKAATLSRTAHQPHHATTHKKK